MKHAVSTVRQIATSLQAARLPPSTPVPEPDAGLIRPTVPIDPVEGLDYNDPLQDYEMESSVHTDSSTLYLKSKTTATRMFTNDGTQRITIQWTPAEILSHTTSPAEWFTGILPMLKDLFSTEGGSMFPWGSETHTNSKHINTMTADDLRNYISPNVTFIRSTKTHTFGIRFGFSTKTPVKWQSLDSTKQAMRTHKVWATVSNLSTTSGKVVTAGYILMKAPNLTHRILRL